ncbi:MAG TPA: glycerol-3-phosphate acyltransferase [Gemmatimonadaceae bacterium]
MIWPLIAVLAGSYVLGCFLAAYYVTRWRHGVDIRASGSGNAGARNMARVYGMPYAVLTLLIDGLKGAIAVWAGLHFVGLEWAGVAALLAAMVGHIWPMQLGFRGGKGVATGLGGILFLDPLVVLTLIGVGAVTFAVTRNFFRSGLLAISLSAPMMAVFGHDLATVLLVAVATLLCLTMNHPRFDALPLPPPG